MSNRPCFLDNAFLPFHIFLVNSFNCHVVGQTMLKVLNRGVSVYYLRIVHTDGNKYILYILIILPDTCVCTGPRITYK